LNITNPSSYSTIGKKWDKPLDVDYPEKHQLSIGQTVYPNPTMALTPLDG
jgi:hypothetical protein